MLLMTVAGTVQAQRLTERFIPIGKSPGLSATYTVIGPIVSVDTNRATLTASHGSSTITATITDSTWIWLDRSRISMSNIPGSLKDCTPGRTAEIKFVRNDRRDGGIAEWVKVEVSQTN
jgi:hypothetical protein